ncbi:phycobilisome linker polypeptide [Dapis sp. BLCC M126]|uniref:phycobilisome linker polypeptide n=1 Tax=Dapis sp. BLCC M126 TaxID=3400189 RepID=UPI003CE6785C
MLGKSLMGGRSSSPSKNRTFVYEVTGLRQNGENDNNDYPFRSSSSMFIQVPYDRMNDEMVRIGRMGGKIVNIRPLEVSEKVLQEVSESETSE